jgi:hypothetical protein
MIILFRFERLYVTYNKKPLTRITIEIVFFISTSLGGQKDLTYNVACIQLFSANAMDVFIKLTQKINEFLQRPWLQGQPFTSGHCYYVVSIVLPLLACVNRLLAGKSEGRGFGERSTRPFDWLIW